MNALKRCNAISVGGNEIEIRAAKMQDLPHLDIYLPRGVSAIHADRMARQDRDEALYLIAWLGDRPVGHALLKWEGTADATVAARLDETCPDVEDLLVAEDMRGCGIGTRLLGAAEERVRERGLRRIGLSVGVMPHNPAQRLYLRLGYRDAGFGQHVEQGEYTRTDGEIHLWQEMCVYLIKELENKELGEQGGSDHDCDT